MSNPSAPSSSHQSTAVAQAILRDLIDSVVDGIRICHRIHEKIEGFHQQIFSVSPSLEIVPSSSASELRFASTSASASASSLSPPHPPFGSAIFSAPSSPSACVCSRSSRSFHSFVRDLPFDTVGSSSAPTCMSSSPFTSSPSPSPSSASPSPSPSSSSSLSESERLAECMGILPDAAVWWNTGSVTGKTTQHHEGHDLEIKEEKGEHDENSSGSDSAAPKHRIPLYQLQPRVTQQHKDGMPSTFCYFVPSHLMHLARSPAPGRLLLLLRLRLRGRLLLLILRRHLFLLLFLPFLLLNCTLFSLIISLPPLPSTSISFIHNDSFCLTPNH